MPGPSLSIRENCPIAGQFLGNPSAKLTAWQTVNAAITGGGVTGLDAAPDVANSALNDGSDNLAAAYNTGDGLHENDAGRLIISGLYKTALQSLSLLP